MLLLDGLDEVREEDASRVLREIQAVADRYPENQFVVTCRIAARDYAFQQFTEVEVADFDEQQKLLSDIDQNPIQNFRRNT